MNKKYLALTIGPILKTLLQARKTRELWAASFLLSRLMEILCEQLDPAGAKILIPRVAASLKSKPLYGAGIYPDRLFMDISHFNLPKNIASLDPEGQKEAIEKRVQSLIDTSVEKLAMECASNMDEKTLEQAREFWSSFFRIRWIIRDLPSIKDGALTLQLSPYLESMELEDTCFFETPPRNFFIELLNSNQFFDVPLTKHLKDGKGSYKDIMSGIYPSTSDIAAYELFKNHSAEMKSLAFNARDDAHEMFYEHIEKNDKLNKVFYPCHKYFCIVQADGDSIGKAIASLDEAADYIRFSETLSEYGQEAAEMINSFGGKPIYIGGDDLLFLAPVRSDQGTIFKLIEKLDDLFPKSKLHPDATLSFGVNITYYKYPLFEAIAEAYKILGTAKAYISAAGKKKNAISFQFTKHSGSTYEAVYSKTFAVAVATAMEKFQESSMRESGGVVSSLIFKLYSLENLFKELINHVGTENISDLEKRLSHTMTHYFNEWKGSEGFDQQKEAITALLVAAIKENGQEALSLFYPVMRLIQFMIAPSISNENNLAHDSKNITQTT